MEILHFRGIGTEWSIRLDEKVRDREALLGRLRGLVDTFEKRFSRFITTSEVNALRNAAACSVTVSTELAEMLAAASRLREVTGGTFDPAIVRVLEAAGYDANYRLTPNNDIDDVYVGDWQINGKKLTVSGPVAFDLGGIGKGYCIDRVADELSSIGYRFFLVEAGGDMFGTSRADGSPWSVGLEWPGRPDVALATCVLYHAGLAASDSSRRKWGTWHHIVDAKMRRPVQSVLGAAAIAPSAFVADQITSAAFLAGPDAARAHALALGGSFYLLDATNQLHSNEGHPFAFFEKRRSPS